MRTLFDDYFRGEVTVSHWFSNLLHSSTVAAITGIETTFAELAKLSLEKLVTTYNTPEKIERRHYRGLTDALTPEEFIEKTLFTMASLKPHDDIIPALELLKEHNFKTVAFSNSSQELINKQISNAGLSNHFDQIISVEGAKNFKPHPKVYKYAAETLSEPIENLTLVAAHDWDTHGAMAAGMSAAYLKRTPAPYNPLYLKTKITASTMTELAAKLVTET